MPSSPGTVQQISLSTHVLDGAAGSGSPGVRVVVYDRSGSEVASGRTGEDGRIAEFASGLPPGEYRIEWETGGTILRAVAAVFVLAEVRHYHLPLLASPASGTVYLGA